jgi:hypothetical protein
MNSEVADFSKSADEGTGEGMKSVGLNIHQGAEMFSNVPPAAPDTRAGY